MSASHHLLLTSLTQYFTRHPEEAKVFYNVVTGTSPLSLRVIDWFVTHYAKAAKVLYFIDDDTSQMHATGIPANVDPSRLRKFTLYLDYRAQLRSFTKMMFDPFRRHHRITFVLQANPLVAVETTVGQMNFFRWAIQNHVLTYIQSNLADVEAHMSRFQAARKEERAPEAGGGGGGAKVGALDAHAPPLTFGTPPFLQTRCFLRFD